MVSKLFARTYLPQHLEYLMDSHRTAMKQTNELIIYLDCAESCGCLLQNE